MLKSSRNTTNCFPPSGPNLSFERFSIACSIVPCEMRLGDCGERAEDHTSLWKHFAMSIEIKGIVMTQHGRQTYNQQIFAKRSHYERRVLHSIGCGLDRLPPAFKHRSPRRTHDMGSSKRVFKCVIVCCVTAPSAPHGWSHWRGESAPRR